MIKRGLVLLALSLFLISFVYADIVSMSPMSPITGKDIISTTANQPGVTIRENNQKAVGTGNVALQNFIKNDSIYFLVGGVVLIIAILSFVIIKKIIRKKEESSLI